MGDGTAFLSAESVRFRTIRLIAFALVFASLAACTAYGFWWRPQLFAVSWTTAGQTRLLIFAACYFAGAVALLLVAPGRLPLAVAVLSAIAACGAAGIGAPAAAGLFFLSSLVLGRTLLWRGDATLSMQDMILAGLLGAAIYMTVVNWTAMLPIHYPLVHMAALVLPLLVWPRALAQCLGAIGALFRPVAWRSRWHYFAFALAAFIPVTHLVGAVLLPQVNNDATVLHLVVPSQIAINHFWAFDVERLLFAVLPLGISWMILPSYLLGGEIAARLVNFVLFLATALLLFSVARRYLSAGAAWLMVALYASTPLLLAENGNIFPENLWVALLFGAAIALARFRESRLEPYFWLAVALAAASLSVKVIGAFLVLVLALFALRETIDRPGRLVWAAGIFALMAAFPYAYAFIKTGNPVFPFMNQIFKSPFYYDLAFTGVNRKAPTGLYDLTFNTQRYVDGGGTNGSLGFHYLALLPLSALALARTYPFLGVVSLVGAAVFVVTAARFAEPNLRYFYPAFPFVMVLIAIAYAQARELSRTLYVALGGFGVLMTAVNVYAMPLAAWAHREFPLAMVFGRYGIDGYSDWAAPERRLIAYLNLTRGHAVRVAIFARPMLVELKGAGVLGHWHDYLFTMQKLAKATSADEVLRLMREERITKFIAFKLGSGNRNLSAAVEDFLVKYTEVEFEAGDADLRRYKEPWRFSQELVANGDFADGLSRWNHSNAAMQDGPPRAVSIGAAGVIIQKVAVDDRLAYRYAVTARCDAPTARVRFWVNWYDGQGGHMATVGAPQACGAAFATVATDLMPPQGARTVDLVVAGPEQGKAVEIARVSLAW